MNDHDRELKDSHCRKNPYFRMPNTIAVRHGMYIWSREKGREGQSAHLSLQETSIHYFVVQFGRSRNQQRVGSIVPGHGLGEVGAAGIHARVAAKATVITAQQRHIAARRTNPQSVAERTNEKNK